MKKIASPEEHAMARSSIEEILQGLGLLVDWDTDIGDKARWVMIAELKRRSKRDLVHALIRHNKYTPKEN